MYVEKDDKCTIKREYTQENCKCLLKLYLLSYQSCDMHISILLRSFIYAPFTQIWQKPGKSFKNIPLMSSRSSSKGGRSPVLMSYILHSTPFKILLLIVTFFCFMTISLSKNCLRTIKGALWDLHFNKDMFIQTTQIKWDQTG